MDKVGGKVGIVDLSCPRKEGGGRRRAIRSASATQIIDFRDEDAKGENLFHKYLIVFLMFQTWTLGGIEVPWRLWEKAVVMMPYYEKGFAIEFAERRRAQISSSCRRTAEMDKK